MDKLTKKQRVFVKEYIKDENGVKSALKAYDTQSYGTANQIAIDNLQKPIIIAVLKSIAEQIPDELLVKVHLEGLDAGRETENGTLPDFAVRHKYLDSAFKLKGVYAPDKNININLSIEMTPERKEALDKILNA